MLQVKALSATDITGGSFLARWEEMDKAASYDLSVYTKSFNEPTTDECDFTDGLSALPQDWYTNATATSGMAGTFGTARPSLRLSANNDLLRTPTYNVDVNGVEFWVKSAASTAGTLKVMGLINGMWTEVASYDVSKFTSAPSTIVINESTTPAMPFGCKSVQIQFVRTSGSVFIDDVVLAYNGATIKKYLPEYQDKELGVATLHEVTGLEKQTHYFYTVGATSVDGLKSLESNEIEVVTTLSSIDGVKTALGIEINSIGNTIMLSNNSGMTQTYGIYSVNGVAIVSAQLIQVLQ